MDESKFSHSICCIGQSGPYAERLNGQNVTIFEMKKREGAELLLPMKLARVFKKIQIDIVHTRNWGAIDGIIGAKVARVPYVIHGEHGRDVTDLDGSNIKRKLIRKGLSYFVDRYMTVSEDFREWLIIDVGIDERKVQTICNGVDTAKFNPDNKDLVRAKHGYSREDLIIGTVGRLDPVKDQQLLIRAFTRLAKKHPRLILLIIGDGPFRVDLVRLANQLARVAH
ncbi:hypothetical protein AMJ44_02150 [candidate division WOR-1 bacterium DG_54_3]|uniref:Glycosyltransferase subfamily 4-like N-terminal domain-containing protein n=1 Tax=candidate division WOR-1 bacterium DG_54_3 TaxID=1703775 RepID=A0A0S7Y6D9_UNCSA|nr:MAG: hypothetical protein AMJ44_02150 [candidate division WOR-1 bacterium DG_54_3]